MRILHIKRNKKKNHHVQECNKKISTKFTLYLFFNVCVDFNPGSNQLGFVPLQ